MSDKPTILLQLDTDPLPSVFDRVVAVDAGAQHVFAYGGVTPQNVAPLVHGCIFTRGPKDLHRTAIFVGGSDVAAAEAVLAEVKKHLIPQYGMSVSVLLDPNGANTTAAAAVRAAGRHLDLASARSLVL
ncbi:MAG: bifunctional NADP-dependent methylenetetrahydromethanopterin dehydrogenase/methylenetetrahydrofolate dehydrogenase, partial [Gemmataceae bacterium]|nr:bifunctional NADP-dependent methylenetetrahydromethanopterin dehydrogenase/methylenetetrahydrofolate dehydrogenase [Gemmataceae bacterium]